MGRSAFALFLLVPLAACQQAAPPDVKDVWTRATAGSAANAAVYMTIRSQTADRLLAASTPAAKKTDLMTMTGDGGAMGMKYLTAIDIPAGQPVTLNAGGLHVWLAGLNQPLTAGQSIPLTLKFEKAGDRQVTVTIVAPAAMPPMPGM
ncbi:MAG: copper chaperone PCu(A)C [Pseudomonadota bacterium]